MHHGFVNSPLWPTRTRQVALADLLTRDSISRQAYFFSDGCRDVHLHCWFGCGPCWAQYPTIRYLPKAIITIPYMETLNILWLGTLDP